MAYSNSQGFTPAGTLIGFKATAAASTWTTIAEAKMANPAGRKLDTGETTNLQSNAKEFTPTIADPGSIEFECNYLPWDASHQALETLFEAQSAGNVGNVPVMIQVPLPGATASWLTITGTGTLTEWLPTGFDRTKPAAAKGSFKLSNMPAFPVVTTAVLTGSSD